MPNYSRRMCRLEQPCEPLSLTQKLYCAFRHHDLDCSDVCRKAGISERRARRLYSESQTARLEADELGRLVLATQHYDLIDFWLREHHLDAVLSVSLIQLQPGPEADAAGRRGPRIQAVGA